MASKILIGIALDGDSEVKRKLQEVGEAGKRSLENIDRKLAGGGGKNNALAGLQQQATGLRAALAPLAEASGLGGLLSGAGLGGIIGRFATGPGGIVAGLSAALVGLAKFGEGTDRAKGRLAALGDAKGFDRLSERAKALGVDVATLQPGQEKFLTRKRELEARNQTVIHPSGFQPGEIQERAAGVRVLGAGSKNSPASLENFEKFDSALFKQIRRDVPSADEAARIKDQFHDAVAANGLTGEALRGLPPNAAGFVTSQVSKSVGRGFNNSADLAEALAQGRIQPIDQTKLINAGAKPNPEFDKAADSARGVTQAFEGLSAASGRLLAKLGGDHAGIGPAIDNLTKDIDNFSVEDKLKEIRGQGADTIGEIFTGKPGETQGDALGRGVNYLSKQLPDIFKFLRDGPEALQQTPAQAFDKVTGYFNKDTPLPERPAYTVPSSESGPVSGLDKAASDQVNAAAMLSKAADDLSQAATVTDGRRYSRQLNPEGRAGGGAVFGAGSATSDSIPAMLSNGEYVVNARAASKMGLARLDRINAGYADGGAVIPSLLGGLTAGSYAIDPTDDGGAIINGVKYGPGSPILNDPIVKAALARARASKAESEPKRHKSDFTGIFGGHVFDTPGSYAGGGAVGRGLRRFASGGYVNILPNFAEGGWADIGGGSAPTLSLPAGAGGGSMGHMNVDLRTNHGDFKMMSSGDVARAMATAARDSADAQTGQRPSWYKGR